MAQRNKNILLIGYIAVFVALAGFYKLAYRPIALINGAKHFRTDYVQGDVLSYSEFYSREIASFPIKQWYLLVNKSNLGLVYYSWISGTIASLEIPEIYFAASIMALTFLILSSLAEAVGVKRFAYINTAILGSTSMIMYMQTMTKEIFLFALIPLSLLGVIKRNPFLLLTSLALIAIVRVYFSAICVTTIFAFFIYGRFGLKVILVAALAAVLVLPFVFSNILTSFTSIRDLNSTYGFSVLYLASLKFFGLSAIWLPFKLIQNILEPLLNLVRTPFSQLILQVGVVLDTISSLTLAFFTITLWRNRRFIHSSTDTLKFLIIFVITYLIVASSIPLVHFRYLVPLIPVLGVVAGALKSGSSNGRIASNIVN